MYENIALFRTAGLASTHAAQRQALTAQNIANADTPGYTARRLTDFNAEMASGQIRATRARHLGATQATAAEASVATTEASPNGNAVSLEEEMVESIDAGRQHEQALAIYRHGMTVLRTALGRK